jgi:hypothetical protein
VAHEAVSRRPPEFPRHGGTPYRGLRVRRWALGCVHRSRTILCRAVPNLGITIRNFSIAVGLGWAPPLKPGAPHGSLWRTAMCEQRCARSG